MAVEEEPLVENQILPQIEVNGHDAIEPNGTPPTPTQRLWNNKVFRFLSSIRLDHTIYPFTLKGEDYLNSKWKRGLDIGVGLIGSVLSLPIVIAEVVAIKVNVPEKNPFFISYRYGKENVPFKMFKIRSQRRDTADEGVTDPIFVGNILRTSSIDELPQFWNVLLGNMSAVGRRPTLPVDYEKMETRFLGELPYQSAKRKFRFTDEQWRDGAISDEFRADVVSWADWVRSLTRPKYEKFVANNKAKPGLTGLYQIQGRREVSLEDRVPLDLVYEKRASLGLDLAIILSTPWAVIRRIGAR